METSMNFTLTRSYKANAIHDNLISMNSQQGAFIILILRLLSTTETANLVENNELDHMNSEEDENSMESTNDAQEETSVEDYESYEEEYDYYYEDEDECDPLHLFQ